MLNALADKMHRNSVSKGFYTDYLEIDDILADYGDSTDDLDVNKQIEYLRKSLRRMQANEKMLLIISEVIEVVEYWRKSGDKLPANSEMASEEFADVFIRLLDSGAFNNIDLDTAVNRKIKKNEERPYKHGVNF